MLYTVICPNCGTEQKGLDLKETNGSVVCSKCDKQFKVEIDKLNNQIKKDKSAE